MKFQKEWGKFYKEHVSSYFIGYKRQEIPKKIIVWYILVLGRPAEGVHDWQYPPMDNTILNNAYVTYLFMISTIFERTSTYFH